MKKGKNIIVSMLVSLTFLLTGCVDNMPEMTEEQSELVAEYASSLLLKYSPNYNYKIVDDMEVVQKTEIEPVKEEVETSSEVNVDEDTLSEEKENTDDNKSEKNEEMAGDKDSTYVDMENANISEMLEIEEFDITFTGYEVVSSYPKDKPGFAITAKKDGKILLLHFDIENLCNDTQICNLAQNGFMAKVNVNEIGYVDVYNTLLENDMTGLKRELNPGEIIEGVLLSDVYVESENEIDSLVVKIMFGDTTKELFVK